LLNEVNASADAFKDSIAQVLASDCACKQAWLQEVSALVSEIPQVGGIADTCD